MHGIDPYDHEESIYECPSCGSRSESAGTCGDCSTNRRNISVPRE